MKRRLALRGRIRIRRREFTAGLLLAAAAGNARARQPKAKRRIAIVGLFSPVANVTAYSWWRGFFAELRRLGDVEGKNLVVERYSAGGHPERYAEVARQAVESRPDLILAPATQLAVAAKAATRTIPIVALMSDPRRYGLAESLARPGGNLTGLSVDAGLGVYGKVLQLLKEVLPSATRVTLLATRETWQGPVVSYMREVSPKLGISLKEEVLAEESPEESRSTLTQAFDTILRDRPDAVYFCWDFVFVSQRRMVVDFLNKNRLPAIFFWKEIVEAGGLISFGDDVPDLFRRWAGIVHRVLAGAKPGDIPISQPTKFVLAVNLKAAKAIGLTFPREIFAEADEVIE